MDKDHGPHSPQQKLPLHGSPPTYPSLELLLGLSQTMCGMNSPRPHGQASQEMETTFIPHSLSPLFPRRGSMDNEGF